MLSDWNNLLIIPPCQISFTVHHRTVLIIFPIILQTITILRHCLLDRRDTNIRLTAYLPGHSG